MKHRMRWENKNFDDMGTLGEPIHIASVFLTFNFKPEAFSNSSSLPLHAIIYDVALNSFEYFKI